MCGSRVANPGSVRRAGERRTVTILFGDIAGFTALSEKLDPEVVQDILDSAFSRLGAIVTGLGGTVDKYLGDAIMAVFGAPVSLGDDPERAVRAALAMQQAMVEYTAELQRRRGFGIGMRIGINTGRVIWAPLGDRAHFTVLGDAVNVASRLQNVAPVGGILIGASTQRHVRDSFALEALPPIEVKGKSEPLQVYRVQGEARTNEDAPRILARTPFVGRASELAKIRERLGAIMKLASGGALTIRAPVGAGKSRIVRETRRLAEEEGLTVVTARAASFGHGSPYAPWTDVVRSVAGLTGLAPEAARERIRARFGGVRELDARWIDELAGVADVSDPEVLRRREQPAAFRTGLAAAIRIWLSIESRTRPMLLLAEDLHWWSAPAIELLHGVADVAREAPLLLLATVRPEPLPAPWPVDLRDEVIELPPLDLPALHAIAKGILYDDPPRGLLERLKTLTGGNPLFAEELVQAYIDHGALRTSRERGGWIWDETKASALRLPATVEGVTQARIDALPERERRALQMAAVAGRVFWENLVVAMGEPEAAEAIAALVSRDMVYARRSRIPAEKEYAFKHATIQSVVYGNTLRVSSLSILVGVLVGGQLMGVLGIILSLPLTASIPVIERIWREQVPEDIEALEQAAMVQEPTPTEIVTERGR